MTQVFFYGLFMDRELLQDKGFHPANVQLAKLPGFQLRIGERATLIESSKSCCYGTVMDLDQSELNKLYAGDGVEDYDPIKVEALSLNGDTLESVSYTLSIDKLSGSNSEYAKKLALVARKLELPRDYIDEIEQWI